MPRKTLIGKVVSAKMQKTVVISVEMSRRHPIYKKVIKTNRRFKARDEMGAVEGQLVRVEESRPYSKEVTWKVIEILGSKKK